MTHFKRKKMSKKIELKLKFWYRGMAKTNFRKLHKRVNKWDRQVTQTNT